MNENITVDADMLRRLNIAKENGSKSAAEVLTLFDAPLLPASVHGSWRSKRRLHYGKTNYILFILSRNGEDVSAFDEPAFLRFLHSECSMPLEMNDLDDFRSLVRLRTRITPEVIEGKQKIKEALNGESWFMDYSSDSYWDHFTDRNMHQEWYATLCSEFFSSVAKARLLLARSDDNKIMGYSVIFDEARLVPSQEYSNVLPKQGCHLILSPRYARHGVRVWMENYIRSHATDIGVDLWLRESSYIPFGELDGGDYLDTDHYSLRVPLNPDLGYKGGAPSAATIPEITHIIVDNDTIYLTDRDHRDYVCTLNFRAAWASSNFYTCVRCGARTSGGLFCSKCGTCENTFDTVFGRVVVGDDVNIHGVGWVPRGFVRQGTNLYKWAENAILLRRLCTDRRNPNNNYR